MSSGIGNVVILDDWCLLPGESDVTEKPIDPIKVYSEKELIREIDKVSSTLVPEKDWSIRIAAMQRVEGLVLGGSYVFVLYFSGFILSHCMV